MQYLSSLLSKASVNLLNPEDVEANRRGAITEAQNERLNSMAFGRQGLRTLIVPLFVIGALFLVFFPGMLCSGSFNLVSLIPILILLIVILGFSKAIYTWWTTNAKIKTDRANGLIRSGVGELNFMPKKGFLAKVGEEDLILSASNDSSGLMPGVRYNFYYLPESRFVLSAEQLGEISSGQVRLALSDILARANDFSPEDLQTNQNGEVTSAQRAAGLKKVLPGLIVMGLAFAFGLLFLFPMFSTIKFDSSLIPLLLIGGFLGIFVAIGFSMVLNAFLDLNTSTPETVEGVGRKETRRKSSGRSSRTVYYYIIGTMEFEVPAKAYPALLDGLTYRAFYMPRTKRLLTLEPLSIPAADGVR